MARNILDTVVAVGGIAGEYEPLTEADITAATGAPYTPPEEFENFRVVDTRTVQLLGGSPIFFETFQTSAFTLRLPYGDISANDAQDGRIYFFKNSGSGLVTINTSGVGTSPSDNVAILAPSNAIIVFHGENDDWTSFSTDNNYSLQCTLGGCLSAADLPFSGAGIEISPSNFNATSFRAFRGVAGTNGTTTIQLEINGSPVSGATLSWTPSDSNFTLKNVTISEIVSSGDRVSFRLTSAEDNAEDIYAELS